MALRSEAHETLSLLFAWDGDLPAYFCDNAKEMIQGKFYHKLKNAACHLKQLELYTPWSNATGREIKDLKGQLHQSTYGTAAESWKSILHPILPMVFIT